MYEFEADLHPPTAYSLGRNLSQWAKEKNRSLIISTHSSEFLIGCLQSLPNIDISVRLTQAGFLIKLTLSTQTV